MQISHSFQKFIFGVVLEQIRAKDVVLFFEDVGFKFRPRQLNKETCRTLLKHVDLDYPRMEDSEPMSYTKLTNKQMSDHVAAIERAAALGGSELLYIAEEWELVMKNIR